MESGTVKNDRVTSLLGGNAQCFLGLAAFFWRGSMSANACYQQLDPGALETEQLLVGLADIIVVLRHDSLSTSKTSLPCARFIARLGGRTRFRQRSCSGFRSHAFSFHSVVQGLQVKDLTIALDNRPGALAEMGEVLAAAGISIEGGGVFVTKGEGVAHFLFVNGAAARSALEAAGISVLAEREVLVQRLSQDRPGQLGMIARHMAIAGVNIEVMYSDHDQQLILVVDDLIKGQQVSNAWTRERSATLGSKR